MTSAALSLALAFLCIPVWTADAKAQPVATDAAQEAGIYEVTTSWSIATADFDEDGFTDFL